MWPHKYDYIFARAISHLNVRLTVMHVTVNEVSSHLYKILTLIIVKTYLQTEYGDVTASLDAQL